MGCAYREDAEELQQAILRKEPGVQANICRRFWKHEWFVRVVREDGQVADYEGVNHYWLECALLGMFGKGQ